MSNILNQQETDSYNKRLVDYMHSVLVEGRGEQRKVRQKIKNTYTIIIILSILMFLLGVAFLTIPIHDYYWNGSISWQSFAIGGLGLADFVALFLLSPIDKMHKLMADLTQITIAVNSFQTQVSLRLLETDAASRITMGSAANYIKDAATSSIESIQKYFEAQS